MILWAFRAVPWLGPEGKYVSGTKIEQHNFRETSATTSAEFRVRFANLLGTGLDAFSVVLGTWCCSRCDHTQGSKALNFNDNSKLLLDFYDQLPPLPRLEINENHDKIDMFISFYTILRPLPRFNISEPHIWIGILIRILSNIAVTTEARNQWPLFQKSIHVYQILM